jgi:Ala-tRNA(Pro) deacylase
MDVKKYLEEQGVDYDVIPHEQVFTAQEVAAVEHVTGHMFAKTVVARGDGRVCLLVLPASRHVDFGKASELADAELDMASEEEMKVLFPDCEIGAEPPFGSQYGVQTIVDESLKAHEDIVFRAGTHDSTIRMKLSKYMDLEKPLVGSFGVEEA